MTEPKKIYPADLGAVLDPTRVDGDVPIISRENLPHEVQPLGFSYYRKTSLTLAGRIEGPFVVETSEGPLKCADGWLAFDARGYPYPIAADEFEKIYEPATPVEPLARVVPFTDEAGEGRWHLQSIGNNEIVVVGEGHPGGERDALRAARRVQELFAAAEFPEDDLAEGETPPVSPGDQDAAEGAQRGDE